MNKANNNGLKKAEAKVETILEQATRLPLAIRRSIVLGVLALVLLLIALVIAGIASCSGNSSREALVQETPAPLNDGEAGGGTGGKCHGGGRERLRLCAAPDDSGRRWCDHAGG